MSNHRTGQTLIRATLALALAIAVAPGGSWTCLAEAASNGNVAFSGRVIDGRTGEAVAGARVYALHLDSKQVFTAAPAGNRGEYELSGLPYGYYDLVVEAPSGLHLGNRVVNAPAGERVDISLSLEDPQPEDMEWWSADPNRRIAGLERAPDGVARIIEDNSRVMAWQPPAAPKPVVASAKAASVANSGRFGTFWKANSGWLVPVLAVVGTFGVGLAITDDNDDNQDLPGSPFE